jgi:phosphatidylglycerophosphate synthase
VAGLVVLIPAASAIRATLHLSAGYPLAATALFLLGMGIAIGFVGEAHPFARFGAANQITTIRLMLAALVASLVGEEPSTRVAVFAVAASVLATSFDGVDGWLARRRRMSSAFGARFDMEIDALLILSLSALAYRDGKAGAWVLASGLLRYAFVAAGWVLPWMNAALPPSRRRQTICVVQVVALILVVAPIVIPPVSAAIAAVALFALVCSFLVDTLWLHARAR